jgi:hypothetical protein
MGGVSRETTTSTAKYMPKGSPRVIGFTELANSQYIIEIAAARTK